MRLNLFNRDLGVCDAGYNFYHCDNGFVGCCSVGACDLEGCPDEDQQATQPFSTTTVACITPTTSSLTIPTETYTTDIGYDPDKTSAGSTTKSLTHSLTTTSNLPSPSSPFLQSTAPTNTTTPQSYTGGSATLSTAAIAGISAGGTILGIFLLTIVSLLIRRQCIAKRMASLPSTSPFADVSQGADKFMEDHPSWQGGQQPRRPRPSIPQGISELP
ncbi:hypothetical protein F5Y06DRAFT_296120 [Hypoxylon sp. FL0890]|nr:hypothetical protein F5Y06DRAFT_296120 [Hypoxylon sp. FL0890]